MKLRLLAISAFLSASAAAQDADWGVKERPAKDQKFAVVDEAVCPVCEAKSDRVTVSGVQELEWDTDLMVTRATFNQYPYVLMTCPKCSFSTYSSQFHKPLTDEQRKAVAKAVGEVRRVFPDAWSIPLSFSLKAALASHKALASGQGTLFEISLLGSYLARNARQEAAEREMQKRAQQHLMEAIKDNEGFRRCRMYYLVGELARRLESHKEALEWFAKARALKDEDLGKLIAQQEQLVRDTMEGQKKPKGKKP